MPPPIALPKLVIIRGPSGSGKSTIARQLHAELVRPHALIVQDHYKERVVAPKDGSLDLCKALLLADVTTCLHHGYDVIVEGILDMKKHQDLLRVLWNMPTAEVAGFYLDVPLAETIRRHEQRPECTEFTADQMTAWYGGASATGFEGEWTIGAESTLEQSTRLIRTVCWGLD